MENINKLNNLSLGKEVKPKEQGEKDNQTVGKSERMQKYNDFYSQMSKLLDRQTLQEMGKVIQNIKNENNIEKH